MKTALTSAAALAALLQPAMAQAQTAQCIAQEDMTAATIYAMPLIVESVQQTCRSRLSPSGFLARNGTRFAQPYRALQAQNWAATSRVLAAYTGSPEVGRMTGQGNMGDLSALFRNQPPELVRPFVDASIRTLVGSKIRSEDCGKIERGMELIAPLPPANAGGIVSLMLELAEPEGPKLCQANRK